MNQDDKLAMAKAYVEERDYISSEAREIAGRSFLAGFEAGQLTQKLGSLTSASKRLREAVEMADVHLSSMDNYSVVSGARYMLAEGCREFDSNVRLP